MSIKTTKDFITYYIYFKGEYDSLITTRSGNSELSSTAWDTYCVVEDFDSIGWSKYNNSGEWFNDSRWESMDSDDFTYTYQISGVDGSVQLYTGFQDWAFDAHIKGYREAKESGDEFLIVHDEEGFEDYKVRWKAAVDKWRLEGEEKRLAEEEKVKSKFLGRSKSELSEIVDILYEVRNYKGLNSLTEAFDYVVNLFWGLRG